MYILIVGLGLGKSMGKPDQISFVARFNQRFLKMFPSVALSCTIHHQQVYHLSPCLIEKKRT